MSQCSLKLNRKVKGNVDRLYIDRRVKHRMTTSDNEWQRARTSSTTSDNEWERVTKNDNEWYNEWQWVAQRMKANERG